MTYLNIIGFTDKNKPAYNHKYRYFSVILWIYIPFTSIPLNLLVILSVLMIKLKVQTNLT